ncbi:hypothetical protein JCM8208_004836 [Rhodotorula glutinis]
MHAHLCLRRSPDAAEDDMHPMNGDKFRRQCGQLSDDVARMIFLLGLAQSEGVKLSPGTTDAIVLLGIAVAELHRRVEAILDEVEQRASSEAPSPAPEAEPSDDDDRGVGSSSATNRRRAREEAPEADIKPAQEAPMKKRRVRASEEE